MKMKKFKLHTGISEIYRISTETYEKAVANNPNYIHTGRDNVKRYFAVCPACDNPIQLIGLYKKLENTDRPYGRQKHNEQAYRFCPYASHSYGVTKKSIKDEMTEYEENIYNGVRENSPRGYTKSFWTSTNTDFRIWSVQRNIGTKHYWIWRKKCCLICQFLMGEVNGVCYIAKKAERTPLFLLVSTHS